MRKRIFSLLTALALCLSLLPATASAADHGDHPDTAGWTELTAEVLAGQNYILSAGSYYLAEDVDYQSRGNIAITGDVTLCLNGHVLNLGGKYIYVGSNAKLTLCDCNSTNKEHSFTVDDETGLWTLDETSGTEILHGGVITGGDGDLISGGVYVYDGSFTMTGGNIAGNTAITDGGGVYVDNGSAFTMTGGSIAGNTAGFGGGVYVGTNSTFNMSGSPTITGNTLTDGTASNVYLYSRRTITIGKGGLTSSAPEIGVSMATPDTFTSGWNTYMGGENPADYFFSENADYGVTLDESGEAKLAPQYTVTFNSNGGSTVDIQTVVEGGTAARPDDPTKTGYTFQGWYLGEEPYNFETTPVTQNITLTAQWEIKTYTVTFDSNNGSAVTEQEVDYQDKATRPPGPPIPPGRATPSRAGTRTRN